MPKHAKRGANRMLKGDFNETHAGTDYERLRWLDPDTGVKHLHIVRISKENKSLIAFERFNKEGDPLHQLHIISAELVVSRTPLQMNLKYGILETHTK